MYESHSGMPVDAGSPLAAVAWPSPAGSSAGGVTGAAGGAGAALSAGAAAVLSSAGSAPGSFFGSPLHATRAATATARNVSAMRFILEPPSEPPHVGGLAWSSYLQPSGGANRKM